MKMGSFYILSYCSHRHWIDGWKLNNASAQSWLWTVKARQIWKSWKYKLTGCLWSNVCCPQIARFKWPTWSPPGYCRPQVGPMLSPGTFLSGSVYRVMCSGFKWAVGTDLERSTSALLSECIKRSLSRVERTPWLPKMREAVVVLPLRLFMWIQILSNQHPHYCQNAWNAHCPG